MRFIFMILSAIVTDFSWGMRRSVPVNFAAFELSDTDVAFDNQGSNNLGVGNFNDATEQASTTSETAVEVLSENVAAPKPRGTFILLEIPRAVPELFLSMSENKLFFAPMERDDSRRVENLFARNDTITTLLLFNKIMENPTIDVNRLYPLGSVWAFRFLEVPGKHRKLLEDIIETVITIYHDPYFTYEAPRNQSKLVEHHRDRLLSELLSYFVSMPDAHHGRFKNFVEVFKTKKPWESVSTLLSSQQQEGRGKNGSSEKLFEKLFEKSHFPFEQSVYATLGIAKPYTRFINLRPNQHGALEISLRMKGKDPYAAAKHIYKRHSEPHFAVRSFIPRDKALRLMLEDARFYFYSFPINSPFNSPVLNIELIKRPTSEEND